MIDNRYELIEQIGVGGMATVWKARDTVLGRVVAIKRLLPHQASDPVSAERFRREAQAIAALNHPGIVTVFDSNEDDDGPYMVLEMVEGETLADKMAAGGTIDAVTATQVVREVATALDYAHESGVVHRDVKPSNIIIDRDGKARITDFGIATTVDRSTTLTNHGNVIGTLAYVAPEILQGEPATPASDIYALGVVAYEALTGKLPFQGESIGALVTAIQNEPTPKPAELPQDTHAALAAAMAKDPSLRPASAGSFATSLASRTTLVVPTDQETRVMEVGAVPVAAAGESQPVIPPTTGTASTRTMSRVDAANRKNMLRAVAASATIVLLLLVALAAGLNDSTDPALGAETTTTTFATTTTAPTTTSTTAATTTTAPAPTVESVAEEIRGLLASAEPPDFKPKDVRRVEDRLDEILEEWSKEEPDKLEDRYDKAFEAVGQLPESDLRDRVADGFVRLAEMMGVDLEEISEEDD